MAPTALNLLTAALSQAGLPADGGTATGGTGQTDAVAGLFQSVLAGAISEATVTAAAQATTPADGTSAEAASRTDLLTQLLGLLEEATEEADSTDESSGVNPELLSQLLAALGVNAQQLAVPTVEITQSTVVTAETTPLAAPVPTPELIASQNPLTPRLTVPTDPGTTDTPAAALREESAVTPTTVPQPSVQRATPPGVVPQTVSVSDATQVAGLAPAVVVQVPIVVDPGQHLPRGVAAVETPVALPVNEPTPVKGLPPVAPGGGQVVTQNQNPTGELEPAALRPAVEPQPTAPVFKLSVGDVRPALAPAVTPPAPSSSQNLPPASATPAPTGAATSPQAATAQNSPPAVPPTSSTPRSDLAARLSPTTPAPTTPVRPATPDIAVTAAQPIDVPVGQLDFTRFVGVSGFLGSPIRPDDVASVDKGTVVPAGAAPYGVNTGRVAPQVAEGPAAPAAPPPPVAEQLSGPITAHLRTRPTDGETELQIRLDPPELGAVKLKIVSTGGDVRAELHLSSDAVRRVVESQLPELRQRLDEVGVKVERFDLTSDSSGGTARDDRGERWRGPPPVEPPPPAVRPRQMAVGPSATGRIDVSV